MYSTDTNENNSTIDLYFVQYDMETLARHINSLNLLKIVRLQKLTVKFIKDYFIKKGFLDGKTGFQICRISAFATFTKYRKLRALHATKGKSITN